MSAEETRLAGHLIREHFGDLAFQVISLLVQHGRLSLREIVDRTGLLRDRVRKVLCTLGQHRAVEFDARPRDGQALYAASIRNCLLRLRYPRFIRAAKDMSHVTSDRRAARVELVVADVLQNGRTTINELLERVKNRGPTRREDVAEIVEAIAYLVENHYLKRSRPLADDDDGTGKGPHVLPRDVTNFLFGTDEPPEAKKRKTSDELPTFDDEDFFYEINFSAFHRRLFAEATISLTEKLVDSTASVVVRTILDKTATRALSTLRGLTTDPVTSFELFQALPPLPVISRDELRRYLVFLADDDSSCRLLVKTGEQGGGVYAVDVNATTSLLRRETIESVVQERFGSRSLRIFRLLLEKKYLEQKQVGELAMVPAREAKELLYRMFAEDFVRVQEIPRTPDHAPSRTFYLFAVDLDELARLLLGECCAAAANLACRRRVEADACRRLIEKGARCEAALDALREAGKSTEEDAEESMTPAERRELEAFRRAEKKLENAEIQLDETMMILQKYNVIE
ncbi:DNA-directed RNA polymerase III subunit RPC3-like [Oscarella lobularis]|uniref:DNA-directed RNA polymerase III subunit RPC3-like n=1 Tax=Oscarella lobularis TaxID=121494 RepID=UPI0033143600